jgi:hypothetical protein
VLILVRLGTVAVAVALLVAVAVAVAVVDAVHVLVAVVVLVFVWVRLTVGDLMITNVGNGISFVTTGILLATGVLLAMALSVLARFAHCVANSAMLVPFKLARRVLVALGAAINVALALAVAAAATAVWSRLLAGMVMIGTAEADGVGVLREITRRIWQLRDLHLGTGDFVRHFDLDGRLHDGGIWLPVVETVTHADSEDRQDASCRQRQRLTGCWRKA